jgi:type VI secretion system secreted protein VgrG
MNDHVTVDGESRQYVKGDSTLTVDGNLHMKQGKALLLDAGNEVHLKAGSKIVIEAGAELTLKAGGSFIKIDASGVSISGAAINLNSGGSAGNGSVASGNMPMLPNGIEPAIPLKPTTLPTYTAMLQQNFMLKPCKKE